MIRKFLYLVLLTGYSFFADAQNYQNDWIDYNKTYYKFKVGPFGYDVVNAPIKSGIVRIPQTSLAVSGLSNIPVEQFQLWKDGQEIPIYTSRPGGILSPTDYIEFWGEIADGKTDKALYKDTSFQLSNYWSLETDSSSYFLTINPAGKNKRLVDVQNNVSAAGIAPEKNFMYTVGRYFRGWINDGFGINGGEVYVRLSEYDQNEGFSSRPVRKPGSWLGQGTLPQGFGPLYLDTLGQLMTAYINLAGNASNTRDVKISLNNDSLVQFTLAYFQSRKNVIQGIPANKITGDNATFTIENLGFVDEDELRIASIELRYPRKFNCNNASSFEFNIDPSEQGRYLKIANFNRGTADAVLYDLNNAKRYIANTSIPDTLQFLLEPSESAYHLVLVRSDDSTTRTINTIQPRRFIDFTQTANQGNYIIISNPLIYGTGSDNYVEQYKNYRSSDTGGGFNAKIIDIHELEDQFAYGISMHPLSIKNFLSFARKNFSDSLAYVFIIGKGVTYSSYRSSETNPLTKQLNLVPTFGNPGSDNLLSSDNFDPVPVTPIGRLSAVTPGEVGDYLKKIKQYESAQRDTSGSIGERLWMKRVLQLSGGNDAKINADVDNFQNVYSNIISGPAFGGDVSTYTNTKNAGHYAQSLADFTNKFNQGSNLLEYLGHSSSSNIDFNLDNPSSYSNRGKYPVFIVNGCLAGNIFNYEGNRMNDRATLSEKFVLEPERGAIGYLSSSSYGVLDYLHIFTKQFYRSIAQTQYGKGFGNIVKYGLKDALGSMPTDFYGTMHAEQFTFHGDPALKMNAFPLPDYAIDSSEINVTPGYLTVAADSFTVNIKIHNLGKAIDDSVHFSLLRQFPDGNTVTAFSGRLPVENNDSVIVKLPVVANRDKGTTILTAIIDDDNLIPEIRETNNTASIKIKITAADLIPISPYNYSIVATNTIDFSASTANAFDSLTRYVMELDTTALFNSPLKVSMSKISTGGLITFPSVPVPLNNTVYYWRVSEDSTDKHWNSFSFIYRDAANAGFEQAHFYQHTQSAFNAMTLDSATRKFQFGKNYDNLFVMNAVYPTSGDQDSHFSITLNGNFITWSACVGNSVIFNIFDPITLKPVLNTTNPYNAGAVCDSMRRYNFEYNTQTPASRKNAMDFLDNFVPDGYYVVVRKIYAAGNVDWAPTVWAQDTALYGHNNSLYHRLKEQGTQIDSFTYPRTFILVYKKNDSAHYQPVSVFSKGLYDKISTSQNPPVTDSVGYVTSPKFGPGKSWNKVKWYGNAENDNNTTSLDVIAIDKNGEDSVFFTINKAQSELDISTIKATDFPYVQLRMRTEDPITVKPYQLRDWSVEFQPVPEGAIAANLGINIPDTVQFNHGVNVEFDSLKGYVVFKNISNAAFDRLKVRLVLYDENNTAHDFPVTATRTLAAGDTLHVSFLANVTELPAGTYNLFLEVNPDNDQPEQYHYNNFLYKYVVVQRDALLPAHLLDFTAKPYNKSVQLKWTVNSEINVSHYLIEYGNDGRIFDSVGYVPVTNDAITVKKYNFIHTNITSSKNYYRLRIVDRDGKFVYSPVRIVEFNNSNKSMLVFPNPFFDELNVQLNNNNTGKATLRLFDLTGKLLSLQTFHSSTTIYLSNLAAGMYIVQVNDGKQAQSFKVYKQ